MTQQSERNIPHLQDIFGFHDKKHVGEKASDGLLSGTKEKVVTNLLSDLENFKNLGSSSVSSSGGNDSAVSVGSTSEEDVFLMSLSKKKKQQRSSHRDKTLTEHDVKHLERHLSMKKTIRKKIMRDLQQAFVQDPNEFRVEDISHEQLKAEINLQSLSFGNSGKKKGKKSSSESNFLDFLRTGSGSTDVKPSLPSSQSHYDDEDSGHGSLRDLSVERNHVIDGDEDQDSNRKVSFWRRFTIKSRNKR